MICVPIGKIPKVGDHRVVFGTLATIDTKLVKQSENAVNLVNMPPKTPGWGNSARCIGWMPQPHQQCLDPAFR